MNSSGGMNNTLCRFPINCQYGEIIQYSYGNPLSIPSSAELQVILKFEYIHTPVASDMSEGTIAKFYKDNPTPEPDANPEDEGILGE